MVHNFSDKSGLGNMEKRLVLSSLNGPVPWPLGSLISRDYESRTEDGITY